MFGLMDQSYMMRNNEPNNHGGNYSFLQENILMAMNFEIHDISEKTRQEWTICQQNET